MATARPLPPSSAPSPDRRATAAPDHARDKQAHQAQEVRRLAAPTGAVVYAAVHSEGRDELRRSTSALAWSGLAAGLSMGFSFVAEAVLRHHLPDAGWTPLVSKLGYTVGFLIVILGRQQLFTENTLTVILPLLRERTRAVGLQVARLWVTVLVANVLGTALFAAAVAFLPAVDADVRATFADVAVQAARPGAATVFVRGIFAGWLIALMVWVLPHAEAARVWIIVIITYVIGIAGFSHIVVGSVEVLYLVVTGEHAFADYVRRFLLPVFAGNVIGGVSLVSSFAHAQFIAASDEGDEAVTATE